MLILVVRGEGGLFLCRTWRFVAKDIYFGGGWHHHFLLGGLLAIFERHTCVHLFSIVQMAVLM